MQQEPWGRQGAHAGLCPRSSLWAAKELTQNYTHLTPSEGLGLSLTPASFLNKTLGFTYCSSCFVLGEMTVGLSSAPHWPLSLQQCCAHCWALQSQLSHFVLKSGSLLKLREKAPYFSRKRFGSHCVPTMQNGPEKGSNVCWGGEFLEPNLGSVHRLVCWGQDRGHFTQMETFSAKC